MNNAEKRVLLVQRISDKNEKNYLKELRELAKSAGYIPIKSIVQKKPIDVRYLIGAGKVKEIRKLIEKYNIHTVIFFNELTASQYLNLSKILKVRIIDRFQLLLEIFSNRAGSKEAKLQIELAKLKRELSYVKEKIHFLKIGEAPGFLSGGRYEYETYAQHIKRRISKIEKKLKHIREKKDIIHQQLLENGLTIVTLTGYTGAGKTTLFNILTKSSGYVDGRPFATISTLLRRKDLRGKKIILTDSIGFMEIIPPALIDSFYTTLEEIAISDLLLLVIDVSDPLLEISRKINTSIHTLCRIGVPMEKILAVFNKIDLVDNERIHIVRNQYSKIFKNMVFISARKNIGIKKLEDMIDKMLPGFLSISMKLPLSFPQNIFSKVLSNAKVRGIKSQRDFFIVDLEIKERWFHRIRPIITNYGGIIDEV